MTRTGARFPPGATGCLGRAAGALVVAALVGSCGDGPVDPGSGPGLQSVVLVGGGAQTGLGGEILPAPVSVRVVDELGRGVPRARVVFDVVAGAGEALPATSVTDVDGVAVTRWRLGPAATRTQALEASLEGTSEASGVVVEATALGLDQADRLVVHGALGPLKGVVLIRESFSGVAIIQEKVVSDTVVVLQPQDAAGVDVVVFAPSNRPFRGHPAWTPGPDTVHVTLQPPVAVAIHFTVQVGDFEQQKSDIADQLSAMEGVWTAQGMGLRLGDITYQDLTGSGIDGGIVSAGLCSGRTPGSAIQVTYVSTIDGGSYDGWGCWSGHVFMSLHAKAYPYLLAHELGHTFTLEHTADGLMYPSSPGNFVRDGEIFRAHFHRSSVLNTIFDSEPESTRRTCQTLQDTSPCLQDDYRLGAGVVSLVADRVTFPDRLRRRGRPLDGVGPPPQRRPDSSRRPKSLLLPSGSLFH